MPTYRFKNIDTDEVFEKWMYMKEREPYLSENPNIQQVPTGFNSVSEIGDWRNKTSDGWNEVLKKVATVPGSKVKPLK
jgi:hypothetical protein